MVNTHANLDDPISPSAPSMKRLAVVVLAAGKSTRFRSERSKVLHRIAGRPMLAYLLERVAALKPARVVLVVRPGMSGLEAVLGSARCLVVLATQREAKGTGHAVAQARRALTGFAGELLVLYGDAPLIESETMRAMLTARAAQGEPGIVALGADLPGNRSFGRLIVGRHGTLERIVEYLDADEDERMHALCNAGPLAADAGLLFALLRELKPENAKKEYYLTDVVALARARGHPCAVVEGAPEEALGINSRAELAEAEGVVQRRLRARAMAEGATLTDPETVYFSADTRLGHDVTVGPNVVFGLGVRVADDVEIRAFCHIEGARIERGAVIGPFARLRPGTVVGEGARVGNFVEVKAARIEAGAKVNHLTYIGDARVGARANVGAGTITCNYDGFKKARTAIGAGAFIGSNSALVAPVRIGARAIVGAGSVITKDVPKDALAVARGAQLTLKGGAARLRARKTKEAAPRRKARGKRG